MVILTTAETCQDCGRLVYIPLERAAYDRPITCDEHR